MTTIEESMPERKKLRLKNKRLPAIQKVVATRIGGRNDEEEKLEDILCLTYALPIFYALSPQELANLEMACRCLQDVVNGENAALIWVASAYAASYGRRILLPVQAFAGMQLPEIKYTLANMKYARGFMNCAPVPLSDGIDFEAVSSICNQAAAYKIADASSSVRVVAGRLRFRKQGLMRAAMSDEEGLEIEDRECAHAMYTSSDMTFCWSDQGSQQKGTLLVASLGLLDGTSMLEISSVIKPSRGPTTLSVDVHLVSPLLPEGLRCEGIQVRVDGSSTFFDLPDLDLEDKQTRKALKSPDGLLCILVVRDLTQEQPDLLLAQLQTKTPPVQAPLKLVTAIATKSFYSLSFTRLLSAFPQ